VISRTRKKNPIRASRTKKKVTKGNQLGWLAIVQHTRRIGVKSIRPCAHASRGLAPAAPCALIAGVPLPRQSFQVEVVRPPPRLAPHQRVAIDHHAKGWWDGKAAGLLRLGGEAQSSAGLPRLQVRAGRHRSRW
jgi:hypothetical protein